MKPEHITKRAGKIDREGTIGGRGWCSGLNMEEGERVKIHSFSKPFLTLARAPLGTEDAQEINMREKRKIKSI